MPALNLSQPLTLATLTELLGAGEPVRLAPEAAQQLEANYQALPAAAQFPGWPYPPAADAAHAASLAAGWLLAHAVGTGPELPPTLVRRLLLLKAYRLAQQPAVNPALVRRLLDFFSRDVWPVVPEPAGLSLTSDELPLAHLGLPLLGLGEVTYQGYRLAAADVLGLFGWEPLALRPPEASALLHGGECTLAYATEALARAAHLLAAAATIAALATRAYRASQPATEPAAATFDGYKSVHEVARQAQAAAAAAVAQAIGTAHPPVEVASGPAQAAATRLPEQPPTGQPLLLDKLARAIAHVGTLSARRTAQLVAGGPRLPRYLAAVPEQPGLLALPQAATGLAQQSQQLVFTAALAESRAVGQPGAGAVATLRVVENTEQLLGLELLAAAQALDLAPPARRSTALAAVAAAFRAHVTFVGTGRLLTPDLLRAARFVREYAWA